MKNADTIQFGLNKKQLRLIMNVIESFPELEKVFVFGSRAIQTNTHGSDIDLAVSGRQITSVVLNRFSSALDDLPLPYIFDVVDYDRLRNVSLKKNIATHGKLLFERKLKSV